MIKFLKIKTITGKEVLLNINSISCIMVISEYMGIFVRGDKEPFKTTYTIQQLEQAIRYLSSDGINIADVSDY